jgi:DinB family protein
MSVATKSKNPTSSAADPALFSRILDEGYGPGAWHGPDMKTALADVSAEDAYWRPGAGRHNIAEIALHHAYTIRSVRAQLGSKPTDAFILDGEDWFPVSDQSKVKWSEIKEVLETEQNRLRTMVDQGSDQLKLILGITCHAVYHAGQIQLIKRLHGE